MDHNHGNDSYLKISTEKQPIRELSLARRIARHIIRLDTRFEFQVGNNYFFLFLATVIASNVINVTLVITSESCTAGRYNQSLLWRKLNETVTNMFDSLLYCCVFFSRRCSSLFSKIKIFVNSLPWPGNFRYVPCTF